MVRSKDAVKFLQASPKGLHSLYKKLLDIARAENGDRDTSKRILSLVAVSLRPLGLLELSAAFQLHQNEDEENQIQFTHDEITYVTSWL